MQQQQQQSVNVSIAVVQHFGETGRMSMSISSRQGRAGVLGSLVFYGMSGQWPFFPFPSRMRVMQAVQFIDCGDGFMDYGLWRLLPI